jgi:hypothetical protein
MKKIRFVKDIAVDYWVSRYDEMDTRTFHRGTVVEYAALEKLDATHANIHFENNDLAVDVPTSAFESVR